MFIILSSLKIEPYAVDNLILQTCTQRIRKNTMRIYRVMKLCQRWKHTGLPEKCIADDEEQDFESTYDFCFPSFDKTTKT